MSKFIERAWYSGALWLYALWPLQWVFTQLASRRRRRLSSAAERSPLPIVIVGNISVGGTGKTPLLIALCKHLQSKGFRPGVASRGYGGKAPHYPFAVSAATPVKEAGDEALIIARHTECPVIIDRDRCAAVSKLRKEFSVDVVLSDDGLQHYSLERDIEIVVVDAQRGFGNGLCLPAGPLREPVARIAEADFVAVNGRKRDVACVRETLLANRVVWASSGRGARPVENKDGGKGATNTINETESISLPAEGFALRAEPDCLINLLSGEKRPYEGAPFKMGAKLQAVSGLGNPQRFYQLLAELPYTFETHSFADHHWFTEQDFDGFDSIQPIVMTEKDAVKVEDFAEKNYWYLTIKVKLSERFLVSFDKRLSTAINRRQLKQSSKY
jgi:tetraacyldisaccharide 4'-kinase